MGATLGAAETTTARRLELDCLGSLPLGRRSTALTARPSAQGSTASSSPLGLALESYGSLPLGRLLYRHSSALAACHSVTRSTTSKACHLAQRLTASAACRSAGTQRPRRFAAWLGARLLWPLATWLAIVGSALDGLGSLPLGLELDGLGSWPLSSAPIASALLKGGLGGPSVTASGGRQT